VKNNDEQKVIDKLTDWAESRPDIRAVLLTSTRAKPGAQLDEFSDYDVVFVAEDIKLYRKDESWITEYGKVLALYRDPVQADYGFDRFIDVTQYESGLKIDFMFWPVGLLKHMAALPELPAAIDDGYKVLLDKDGLAPGMKPPSYNAFIPKPPTEEEYLLYVESIFNNAHYAAKHIRRGDIFPLMDIINYLRYERLGRLLWWKVEIEHDWNLKSGNYGRGLQKYLSPELLHEIESTYLGESTEAKWDVLFRLIELYCKIAREVGDKLGFPYPEERHKKLVKYIEQVKNGELP